MVVVGRRDGTNDVVSRCPGHFLPSWTPYNQPAVLAISDLVSLAPAPPPPPPWLVSVGSQPRLRPRPRSPHSHRPSPVTGARSQTEDRRPPNSPSTERFDYPSHVRPPRGTRFSSGAANGRPPGASTPMVQIPSHTQSGGQSGGQRERCRPWRCLPVCLAGKNGRERERERRSRPSESRRYAIRRPQGRSIKTSGNRKVHTLTPHSLEHTHARALTQVHTHTTLDLQWPLSSKHASTTSS